jgi:hypothetical protein
MESPKRKQGIDPMATETLATVYFEVAGIEREFNARGLVETGGSNSYGSDEPAWAEVSVTEFTDQNGNPVTYPFANLLGKDCADKIESALLESIGIH